MLHAPAAFNQGCKAVVPSPALDARYLQHWFDASRDSLQAAGSGSTFKELASEALLAFDIPFHSLDEQRRIADFLDDQVARIDKIIAAKQDQVSATAWYEVSLIRQGVSGIGLLGSKDATSPLVWVPRFSDRASVRMLARVLTLQRGVDLTDAQRRPGDVPVITTAGVVGMHDESVATGPGVVIGRYGTVGNIHWVEGPYWPHNTTLYVREFFGNEPRWCYYLLRAYPYAALQARAAVPGINRNEMATDLVPWISPTDQKAAAIALDGELQKLGATRETLNASIGKCAEYKQSLITAAVTGELDVTTAASRVPV